MERETKGRTAGEMDRETETALKLWVVLNRAHRAVWRHDRRDIESHGLHPSEFAVLEVLYSKGPLPLGEVGARVLLTSGSITHVVDKLEGKGLLVRRPCPEDRRVSFAELTESGGALIADIFPAHTSVLREALAGLDREEKRTAIRLLKQLGRYADDLY